MILNIDAISSTCLFATTTLDCRGRKSRPPRAFLVLFCAFSGACFFVAFLVPAGGIQCSLFSCFFVLLEACAFLLLLLFRPLHVCARRGRCGSPWVLQIVPGGQGGICVVLTALFLQFPCAFFKFTTVFEWACLKPVDTLDFPFFSILCSPRPSSRPSARPWATEPPWGGCSAKTQKKQLQGAFFVPKNRPHPYFRN